MAHKSNVEGPKVAGNNGSKKSSGVKQPEPTLHKLSQSGRPAQFDFLSPSGVVADSDSSSSESSFRLRSLFFPRLSFFAPFQPFVCLHLCFPIIDYFYENMFH